MHGTDNAGHRLHPGVSKSSLRTHFSGPNRSSLAITDNFSGDAEGFMIPSVVQLIRRLLTDFDTAHREKVTALTVMEMEELENIFALLLLGAFVGLPSPPTFLAVELLPYMERELQILCKRAKESNDMLAEMFGTLGVE